MEDFFEDEISEQATTKGEEVKPAPKPKSKLPIKKQKKQKEKQKQGVRLDIWWVIVLALVAFGCGFLVRGWIQPQAPKPSSGSETMQAPPLTPEQLEEGKMPKRHPSVPGQSQEKTSN